MGTILLQSVCIKKTHTHICTHNEYTCLQSINQIITLYTSNILHFDQLYLTKVEEMEKEMAAHSSIFPWEISWSEKSGGL